MIKLILAAALAAAPAHAAKKEKPMEWKGQNSGRIDPGTEVAADADAWMRLWLAIGQDAPAFDFKKFYAVAVFAGERPTGGYVIEFLEPQAKGSDVTVRYRVNRPTGFTTQALTAPWKIRAFPRVKGKVFVLDVPAAEDKTP
jgi:hypothetical protein